VINGFALSVERLHPLRLGVEFSPAGRKRKGAKAQRQGQVCLASP